MPLGCMRTSRKVNNSNNIFIINNNTHIAIHTHHTHKQTFIYVTPRPKYEEIAGFASTSNYVCSDCSLSQYLVHVCLFVGRVQSCLVDKEARVWTARTIHHTTVYRTIETRQYAELGEIAGAA